MRTLLVMIAMGQFVLAQGQTFNRRYDTFGQDHAQVAWSIDPNGTDGYAVTTYSHFADSVYLYTTAALIRLDAEGLVLTESKMLYGMRSVYAGWSNSAQRVRDGGIAIGGNTHPPSGIRNAAIIRYAANGDSLWLREYGDGVNSWIGRQVKQDKDGGYVLCGERFLSEQGDAFLIKTDSLGNEEWRETYGGSTSDYAMAVDTTADEGYFVGGQFRISQNNSDLWVFKVDAEGDMQWSTEWGSPYLEPNAHLTTLANGNPIIASSYKFQETNVGRLYAAELDQEDGQILWQHQYGPVTSGTLYSVKEVRPGEGAIAAGIYFEPDTSAYFKGVMLRIAPDGDSLWMRTYVYCDSLMSDGRGWFEDVLPTNDGGFIACGATNGSHSGIIPPEYDQDAWVVKVDSMGCIVPGCDGTGVTEFITNLGHALTVYPNPASESVFANVTLPTGSPFKNDLRLRLMTARGSEVHVQRALLGANQLPVRDLAAGLYYLHLTSGSTWLSGTKLAVE